MTIRFEGPGESYRFYRKIGTGSASKLYQAENRNTGENVVIKKIKNGESWEDELKALKKTDALKGTISLRDVYRGFRSVYIVTPYYDNLDLYEHIDANAPYDEHYVKLVIVAMLKTLSRVHEQGWAHLDVKPENFMVVEASPPDIVLIDFGHANKVIPDEKLTYGTLFYICPEGFDGHYSTKSDIWSVGICTHLMLTGDFPFSGDNKYYQRNVKEGILDLSNMSRQAKQFVVNCLHMNPANRPSALELLEHPWLTDLNVEIP